MRTTTMFLAALCVLAGPALLPGQVTRETLYETSFDTADAVDNWQEVSGTWALDPDAGTYTGSGSERILTVYDGPLADGSDNSELRDYMISAELQRNNVAGGLAGRYMDAENYYLFRHHPDGQLQIYAIASSGNTLLGTTAFPNADLPEKYVLRFEMIGATLTGTLLDGETELASVSVEDDSFPRGAAGLRIWAAEQPYHDFALVVFRFPEARSPNPPDGAIYEDIRANLTWQGGDFAVSHDVYIGTDFDQVNEATPDSDTFARNVTDAELMIGFPTMPVPGGLVPGTTYYWRVDAVNEADENSPWKGEVWSFQLPPTTAWKPQPADGVEFVHPSPQLSWARGWNAIFYTVYLGTDRDEVANATTGGVMGVETSFLPEPLEAETTYYWRVDLFNGTQTQKGDVWSFTTLPAIAVSDPNLVGWWTLDEGMGTTAVDWSGHGSHGTMIGEPQWVAGYAGGALSLDGVDDYVDIGAVGVSGAAPRTVAGWAKADRTDVTAWTNVFGLVGPPSGTRNATFFTIQVMGDTGTSTLGYYGLHRYGWQQDIIPIDLEWHHLAATYDGATAAWYGDGQLIGSEEVTVNTRDYVLMGKRSDNSNFFPGAIDDVRVYNKVLTAEEIGRIIRIDPLLAWDPSPRSGAATDVVRAAALTWQPGDTALQHDVYLGTDRAAVSEADASDTTGVYRGRQAGTVYTPDPPLDWGQDYFWRIDEVAGSGTIAKGLIWSFRTTDFLIVDDFESYTNDVGNRVFETWVDGIGFTKPEPGHPGNESGAVVGHDIWSADSPYFEGTLMETVTVHGDNQSMPLYYNNAPTPYYSEATRTWDTPENWTLDGLDTLRLYVRPEAGNEPGMLYIGIEDSAGGGATVAGPDAAAPSTSQWFEWSIPLSDLTDAGVNVAAVRRMTIRVGDRNATTPGGAGLIYVDDIRVTRPVEERGN